MSGRRRDELLADLLDFGDELARAISGWTEKQFLADTNKQRIVERLLELLGEVATQLGDDAPGIDVDWKALRDLRILLAHVYQRIDPRRLWAYAKQDVPDLRDAVQAWVDGGHR